MNRNRGSEAYRGERNTGLRRYSYLSTRDLAILAQLPLDAARSLERLIRSQARSDAREREHTTVEADLDADLETLEGERATRAGYGPGGGRRAPTRPPAQ